ncbi:RTC4-like domain-containing protein [Xylariaceae sp. FL1651]|nr:RTC4-like domain-containing protein [Xylariaceae sp. FL1651]
MTGSGAFSTPRRVGLSRHSHTGSLLSQVGGKKVHPLWSTKRQKIGPSSSMKIGSGTTEHDSITAPPESSDNEAENTPFKDISMNDSNDSDEDYIKRRTADIAVTKFSENISSQTSKAKGTRGKSGRLSGYGNGLLDTQIDEHPSIVGSKRSAGEDQPKGNSQRAKELEPLGRKQKKPHTTYGTQQKSTRMKSSQTQNITRKGASAASAAQDGVHPVSSNRLSKYNEGLSPMESQSPRKSFKTLEDSSEFDEADPPQPSFRQLSLPASSPSSTPRKRRLKQLSPLDQSPEIKNATRNLVAARKGRVRAPQSLQRKKSKSRKIDSDPGIEESSQRPVFKLPGLEDFDSFDDSGSQDATATPRESQDDLRDLVEIEEIQYPATPRCPMCHEVVDRELLDKHLQRGKMSIRKQTAFCRSHKRQSAFKSGTEKGYPDIDWGTLDSRCSAHQEALQSILEGTQPSHYRNVLKDKVDSGKNRTLLTNSDNLTPGYYGPRGLQVMTEFIMRTLSSVIRKRAVEDRLISARSYTGYVQAVLVPELTARLIMEDMSVTEEKAREILQDSIEIGELLHEEMRDVVRNEEEGDEVQD